MTSTTGIKNCQNTDCTNGVVYQITFIQQGTDRNGRVVVKPFFQAVGTCPVCKGGK